MLLTTHDLADVERLCERLVIIDHGTLIEDSTVAGITARYGTERTLIVDLAEPGPPARDRRGTGDAGRRAPAVAPVPAGRGERLRAARAGSRRSPRCATSRSRNPTSRASCARSTLAAVRIRPLTLAAVGCGLRRRRPAARRRRPAPRRRRVGAHRATPPTGCGMRWPAVLAAAAAVGEPGRAPCCPTSSRRTTWCRVG